MHRKSHRMTIFTPRNDGGGFALGAYQAKREPPRDEAGAYPEGCL